MILSKVCGGAILACMKKGVLIFWLIILAVVVAGVGVSISGSVGPGKYDAFAQCLADKGVKMYGAFWCPHCQRTKALFGKSAHLLPYIECSTPDGKAQTQVCIDNKVVQYPTWVFPNGVRFSGEHALQEIATNSGCVLPQ